MKSKFFLLCTIFIFMSFSCIGPIKEAWEAEKENKESRRIDAAAENFELIEVNNEFSIRIPNYMFKTSDLYDDAPLQYKNKYKDICVVVLAHSKKNFQRIYKNHTLYDTASTVLQNYRTISFQYLIEKTILLNKVRTPEKINDLDAEITEAEVSVDKANLYYLIGYIDGHEKLYQVIWRMHLNKKQELGPIYYESIQTFELMETNKNEK